MLTYRLPPNKMHSNSSFLRLLLGAGDIVSHRNNFRRGGFVGQIWPKEPISNFMKVSSM